ncbi:MAG: FAD:protein FMN transferase, partial [Treponema sp.]|nr:FAD:protein FMN transferase [Treponema sp.]
MTVQVLGTFCTVNLYEDGSDRLYNLVFERLDQIDSEFNLNNPDSELNKINSAAGLSEVEVGADLALVLDAALNYAEKSDGAFDPTIGPLVRLWGINTP